MAFDIVLRDSGGSFNIALSATGALSKNLSDSVTSSETLAFSVSQSLTESLTISESFEYVLTWTLNLRSEKGSPLSAAEMDANFDNLNLYKLERLVTSIASSSTPNPSSNNTHYYLTALSSSAVFAAPSGTPVNGQRLVIRIKDDGTARALSFNSIYRGIGVTLPTTTVVGNTCYLFLVYNEEDVKWDVLGVI